MANDAWTQRTQTTTRANASRNGEIWTSADLDFVTAFTDDATDADLALSLNRTLFAIQSIQHAVRAGRATPATPRVAASDRPYRGWVEGMGDA